MSEEAFFTSLGFDPNPSKNSDLEFLDTLTVWDVVKGKSIFQPSEDFVGYTGYRLPFAKAKKTLSPTIYVIAGKLSTTGHNLKLIGIFYQGKLVTAKLEGRVNMNERETIFIWDFLSGAAETGLGQGILEGIKAGI